MDKGVELGVSLMIPSRDTRAAESIAQEAERSGLDHLAIPDSPRSFPETFLTTQAVLSATTRLSAGPAVINPITRSSEVARSALTALSAAYPGRASLAVGRGESAVQASGRRRSTTAELERYVTEIRGASHEAPKLPPVAMAAAGPRTIAAAARSSDVVLLDVGVSIDAIDRAIGLIRRQVGPSTDRTTPEIWTLARGLVAEDCERGRRDLAGLISASAGRLAGAAPWKQVPAHLKDAIDIFAREYSFETHGVWDESMHRRNLDRMQELGIDGFLFDRFALLGSPELLATRVRKLGRLGVTRVVFSGAVPMIGELVMRLGNEVGPLVRQSHH